MSPGCGYGFVDDELELELLCEELEELLLEEELDEPSLEELLLELLEDESSELELVSPLDSVEELLLLLLGPNGLKEIWHEVKASVNIASKANLLVVFFIWVLLVTQGLLFYWYL